MNLIWWFMKSNNLVTLGNVHCWAVILITTHRHHCRHRQSSVGALKEWENHIYSNRERGHLHDESDCIAGQTWSNYSESQFVDRQKCRRQKRIGQMTCLLLVRIAMTLMNVSAYQQDNLSRPTVWCIMATFVVVASDTSQPNDMNITLLMDRSILAAISASSSLIIATHIYLAYTCISVTDWSTDHKSFFVRLEMNWTLNYS